MEKDPTGACSHCGEIEKAEHVLIKCRKYARQRKEMERAMRISVITANILGKPQS